MVQSTGLHRLANTFVIHQCRDIIRGFHLLEMPSVGAIRAIRAIFKYQSPKRWNCFWSSPYQTIISHQIPKKLAFLANSCWEMCPSPQIPQSFPSTARISSPSRIPCWLWRVGLSPASSAGLPGSTLSTCMDQGWNTLKRWDGTSHLDISLPKQFHFNQKVFSCQLRSSAFKLTMNSQRFRQHKTVTRYFNTIVTRSI